MAPLSALTRSFSAEAVISPSRDLTVITNHFPASRLDNVTWPEVRLTMSLLGVIERMLSRIESGAVMTATFREVPAARNGSLYPSLADSTVIIARIGASLTVTPSDAAVLNDAVLMSNSERIRNPPKLQRVSRSRRGRRGLSPISMLSCARATYLVRSCGSRPDTSSCRAHGATGPERARSGGSVSTCIPSSTPIPSCGRIDIDLSGCVSFLGRVACCRPNGVMLAPNCRNVNSDLPTVESMSQVERLMRVF